MQIFQPEFCSEKSDDTRPSTRPPHVVGARRATVLNAVHGQFVAARFHSVETAELVSTAEGEKVTVHSSSQLTGVFAGIGAAGIVVVGRACAVPRRLAGAGRRNQDGLVNGDPVGAPEAESVEHLCFALGIRQSSEFIRAYQQQTD